MTSTMSIQGLYNWNNNIFADLHVPSGVNKQNVINEILWECGCFECTVTDIMSLRYAIGVWSVSNARDWEKVVEASKAEFNPIENYDRIEEWTDTGNSSTTGNSTDSVTGYNETGFVPSNKNDSTGSSNANSTHKGRTHGNIGVTTAPQMLREFLEIEPELNIYKYIAHSFKKRFCVMVY